MAAVPASVFRFQPGAFDGAIIDLDGTLVDTLGDFVAAINLMLRDLWPEPFTALTVDARVVETMVGKGSENLVRSVLNHAQAPANRAQAAIDLIASYYRPFARYQHHYQSVSGLRAGSDPEPLKKYEFKT